MSLVPFVTMNLEMFDDGRWRLQGIGSAVTEAVNVIATF
jgi:hypothetical protein